MAGLILCPFLPKLIKMDTVPSDVNIYILYALNLGNTVISYWFFAYKKSLLDAHQRTDITSKITLITSTFMYIAQLIVLLIFKSFYLYTAVLFITSVINNLFTAISVDKLYPFYKPNGKLQSSQVSSINGRVKDLFTAKIGGVVVGSVDTIVISAYLGLTALAIYQNYMYLVKAVISMMTTIFIACTAGIGNSIILESTEKNFGDLKIFTFLISWVAGFCTCCFLCLFQPFMALWVGEDLLLEFSSVICFSIYFFVYEINQLLNTYKDAAGIWHEDRFRPLITALCNLILNLILVRYIGVLGVILCTVISTVCVGMPWLLHNLFSVLFSPSYLRTYLCDLFGYIFVITVGCAMTYILCSFVPFSGIIEIVIDLLICCIVPNVLYYLIFRKSREFKHVMKLVDRILGGKFSMLKRLCVRRTYR